MGSKIGRPVKVDEATLQATHGKYAHIYVEVDFSKPLLSKFRLGKQVQRIEYESIHLICFSCGCYGHIVDNCPSKETTSSGAIPDGVKHDSAHGVIPMNMSGVFVPSPSPSP